MSLSPGVRLGSYEATARIGAGGMGEVYQARDTKLDRDVALKVLPDAFTADPDRLARFEREAKVLASLNHPNIGHIYELEEAEGTKALVLELVEGPTLADRIAEGPIPIDEALPIAKQIAEALEAAHEQGIIHRDLKPANVKVKADGTVKVLDFGLAKAFQPDASGMMCSWKGSRAARSDRTRIEQQHASQLVSHVAASSAQRIAEAGVTDRLIDTGANRSSRHADTLRRIEAANIRADVCGACEAPIAVGDPVEEASMRSRVRSVVLAGTLLAVGSSPAVAQNPNWTRPFEGHRVIGNLYAVGTYDLAVFLVTGSEGHILVNTGLEDSTPLIRENIESLGFRLEDVKILLQMQAHWDHTAALAEIKRITGAEMWATLHDAPVLADGGFSDPHFGGRQSFDPVAVDKIIRDGEVIELGDIRMTVLETPGHTAGSSSYLMQVREGGGTYDVAIANMAFINPGKRLVENPTYPGVADDFAETFRKQKALDVDVWVSAHGSQYGLHDKYQPGQAYSPDTFVDPEGFLGAVERLEQDYLAQLRAEGR